jgi:F-type H+/Na+-transporting ATPase subunit alpha
MATTTLNPSEISELIKARIDKVALSAESRNEGSVTSVSDGIVRVHGLADAMQGEMIELPGDTYALALNLERDSVGAVVLGDYEHLREGDVAKTTGRILEVPTGPEMLGRVVNALGEPIDGKGPIEAKVHAPVEKVAPGVIWRKSVSQPVQTGYKSIDSMIPIGRGQRELIIGDRQTGKTAVAIDAIINQRVPASSASTWPSARRTRPSPTSCASSRSTARWPSPRGGRVGLRVRGDAVHRTVLPAAPWASTSATAARTR